MIIIKEYVLNFHYLINKNYKLYVILIIRKINKRESIYNIIVQKLFSDAVFIAEVNNQTAVPT